LPKGLKPQIVQIKLISILKNSQAVKKWCGLKPWVKKLGNQRWWQRIKNCLKITFVIKVATTDDFCNKWKPSCPIDTATFDFPTFSSGVLKAALLFLTAWLFFEISLLFCSLMSAYGLL